MNVVYLCGFFLEDPALVRYQLYPQLIVLAVIRLTLLACHVGTRRLQQQQQQHKSELDSRRFTAIAMHDAHAPSHPVTRHDQPSLHAALPTTAGPRVCSARPTDVAARAVGARNVMRHGSALAKRTGRRGRGLEREGRYARCEDGTRRWAGSFARHSEACLRGVYGDDRDGYGDVGAF